MIYFRSSLISNLLKRGHDVLSNTLVQCKFVIYSFSFFFFLYHMYDMDIKKVLKVLLW